MSPSQQTAAIAAPLSALVLSIFHRRIFALTGSGLFFLSSILLVYVGVLLAPWTIQIELPQALPYLRWEEIRDRDLENAIWLVGGGLALALCGNILAATARSMLADWKRTRWPIILVAPEYGALGTTFQRLAAVSAVSLLLAIILFLPKMSVAVDGLINGYGHLDQVAQYDARFEMQRTGLLYYSLVYNVLPFLAVLSWTGYRLTRRVDIGRVAFIMMPAATFFLVVTFEKMSLVLFLIAVLVAYAVTGISRRAQGTTRLRITGSQLITTALIAGSMLVMLFYLQYANLANALAGELRMPVADIIRVAATNLFSRQSIQPMMYLRVFPDIDPHYGFSNIGMLMSALGLPFYSDTISVLHFFSVYDFGSTSVGAIGDFYGAFGWNGVVIGSLLLGAALHWVDATISGLQPSALTSTLAIWWMTVAYYLSQGAVARCISSYGGGAFFVLYLVLSVRGRRVSQASAREAIRA